MQASVVVVVKTNLSYPGEGGDCVAILFTQHGQWRQCLICQWAMGLVINWEALPTLPLHLSRFYGPICHLCLPLKHTRRGYLSMGQIRRMKFAASMIPLGEALLVT